MPFSFWVIIEIGYPAGSSKVGPKKENEPLMSFQKEKSCITNAALEIRRLMMIPFHCGEIYKCWCRLPFHA